MTRRFFDKRSKFYPLPCRRWAIVKQRGVLIMRIFFPDLASIQRRSTPFSFRLIPAQTGCCWENGDDANLAPIIKYSHIAR